MFALQQRRTLLTEVPIGGSAAHRFSSGSGTGDAASVVCQMRGSRSFVDREAKITSLDVI